MKTNFPSAFTNNFCLFPTCMEKDSQNHIFESKCFSPENEITETNINYADIFSNDVIAQVRVIKILFSRLDIRRKYITLSGEGFPMDPRSRPTPNLKIRKAKLRNKRKYKSKTNNISSK